MKDFIREPTNKQRVLKRHPKAFARWMSGVWCICVMDGDNWRVIGRGETAVSAWADAAQRLT